MVVSDASGGEALRPPPQPPSSFFIFLKVASSHGIKITSTSTIHNIHNNNNNSNRFKTKTTIMVVSDASGGGGAAPSRTSNSGPSIVCFVHFDEGMCAWPKLCAIFHAVFGQRSGSNNFFLIRSVRQFLLPFHTKAFLSTWIIFFDAHNIFFWSPGNNFCWSSY